MMKLHLQRDQQQRTSVFGRSQGWDFSLWYQLELSHQEQATVERYGLGEHMLAEYDDPRGKTVRVSVAAAQQGARYDATSLQDALKSEGIIYSSCKEFKMLLEGAERWGGRHVFEIG